MKLKYKMTVIDIGGTPVAFPFDDRDEFRGGLIMNESAEFILKLLENDVEENEIVTAMKNKYAATDDEILYAIRKIVRILKENNLLLE